MVALDYSLFLDPVTFASTSDTSVNFHKSDLLRQAESGFPLSASQRAWLLGEGVFTPDSLVFPKQVHGDGIWIADNESSRQRGVYEADAVVTDQFRLPIAIRTADCLPILLHSSIKNVIGAVHAGWKSTRLEIVRKTISLLQERYGVQPQELKAVFGPCIRTESYVVGAEFREHFPEDVTERNGQLRFDLAGANLRQMIQAGVLRENVSDCLLDTVSRPLLHSYRRDGEGAGRMLSFIMMAG